MRGRESRLRRNEACLVAVFTASFMVLRSYTGGLFSDNRQRFPASLSYTYAGDIEKNTYRARAFSRFAVEKNCIPMAPHLLFPQFMNEATERWLGLKMGIALLGKCESHSRTQLRMLEVL